MKVLHFFKTYIPDGFHGVERVIWSIAEATADFGVQSDVLSLSRNRAEQEPLPVARHLAHHSHLDLYVASTGFSLSVFGKFSELARKADIVHYHFPWPMMDLVNLVTPPRRPTVVTYHSDIVKQGRLLMLYRPLMLNFLERVDHIVATSPQYLATSPVLQKYHAKTSVIPIGIEDAGDPPDGALLQQWRDRVGQDFFLFLGAPRYYKGLEFLLDAARRSGLRVVIAGAEEAEIVALAGRTVDSVVVVGRIDDSDKNALLALCRAFVFPSHLRSEAFGVALAEAARAGKPMISCEIGTGTSYVNVHGVTGVVVPPADPTALADAMQRLAGDQILAKAMGIAALARFRELFRAAEMGRKYLEVYSRLLREDSGQDRHG